MWPHQHTGLVGYTCQVETNVGDKSVIPRGLVWDFTSSVKYACWKSPSYWGALPCLLWSLYGQGFDASLVCEGMVKGKDVFVPAPLADLFLAKADAWAAEIAALGAIHAKELLVPDWKALTAFNALLAFEQRRLFVQVHRT